MFIKRRGIYHLQHKPVYDMRILSHIVDGHLFELHSKTQYVQCSTYLHCGGWSNHLVLAVSISGLVWLCWQTQLLDMNFVKRKPLSGQTSLNILTGKKRYMQKIRETTEKKIK